MRVLMLHNRYRFPGGEEVSYATDVGLLRTSGHEVHTLEEHNDRIHRLGLLRSAIRTVWSQEAFGQVRRELRQRRYDVLHVQNFFPLISPSVYYAARSEGVAVVQTLRNYRLLCPGSDLLRNRRPCELCVGKMIPWPGVRHACYRDSRSATAAVAAMLSVHRAMGTWARCVDRYIALTPFGRDKFIQGGLPAAKIAVRANSVHPDPGPGPGGGKFAVFVGRLDEQKGVRTLLRAWRQIGGALPLKIVGDGPLDALVDEVVKSDPNIAWLGNLPLGDTLRVIGEAELLVFCSESYEAQPRVVIEAFARGTPVIAPRLGAMAGMVDDGVSGRLFTAADDDSLVDAVKVMLAEPSSLTRMRAAARHAFEKQYLPAATSLVDIYQEAIGARVHAAASEGDGAAP